MSRVDQAFKRASGRTPAESVEDTDTALIRVDEFPAEDRRAATVVHRSRQMSRSRETAPAESEIRPAQLASEVGGKVVTDTETSWVSVEEYRRLATSLHLLQKEKGLRSLIVSSALPRDGKSLTSTNLALTLSESYKRRVLLIDADFRRPSLHKIFGLPNVGGLAEGLRGTGPISLPFVQLTNYLTVLPAGVTDNSPVAGLTSERMRSVVLDVQERFDWVIVDTPPVGLLSDANLLANLVDGVLLVIGAWSTPFDAISRAVSEFGRERIVGVVLNRVIDEASKKKRYYEGYYATADSGGAGA